MHTTKCGHGDNPLQERKPYKYHNKSKGTFARKGVSSAHATGVSTSFSQEKGREIENRIHKRRCSEGRDTPRVGASSDDQIREYERSNNYKSYFHLLESLWRKNETVHKKPVTPDYILQEIDRFKHKKENKQDGPKHQNWLETIRLDFLHKCYYLKAEVDGKTLTAQYVINAYGNNKELNPYRARDYSYFLFECFKNPTDSATVDGGIITAEKIIQYFPSDKQNLCKLAEIKRYLCINNILLGGKPVTAREVIDLFDRSSHVKAPLFKGFFLQEAYFKNILLDGKKITPDMVCGVFEGLNTEKGRQAKEHFMEKLHERKIPFSDKIVTSEHDREAFSVLNAEMNPHPLPGFQHRQPNQSQHKSLAACASKDVAGASMMLNQKDDPKILEEYFHSGKRWNNCVVTTADVLASYERSKQLVGYLKFLQSLWCNKTAHNDNLVTPDFILDEIARLTTEQHRSKKGIQNQSMLETIRLKFLQDYCNSGVEVEQKKLTAQDVIRAYGDHKKLDVHRAGDFSSFLFHCFKHNIVVEVDGEPVSAEKIIECHPNDTESLCKKAEIIGYLCINGIYLNAQPVGVREVIDTYDRSNDKKAPLFKASFLRNAFENNMLLDGKKMNPDRIYQTFVGLDTKEGQLARAHFIEALYNRGLPLGGKPLSPEAVCNEFSKLNTDKARQSLLRCQYDFCLAGIKLNGNNIEPGTIIKEMRKLNPHNKSTELIFLIDLYKKGIMLEGKKIDPMEIIKRIQTSGCSDKEIIEVTFWLFLYHSGTKIEGKPIDPQVVFQKFSLSDNPMVKLYLADLKYEIWRDGFSIGGREITATDVVHDYRVIDHPSARLQTAYKLENCFMNKIPVDGKEISSQDVLNAFDAAQSFDGKMGRLHFMDDLCTKSIKTKGKETTPRQVIDFANGLNCSEAFLCIAHFTKQLFLRGILLDGRPVTADEVIRACLKVGNSKGLLCKAMFMKALCLRGIKLNGEFVSIQAVLTTFPEQCKYDKADFLRICYEEGISDDGKKVTLEAVVATLDDLNTEESQISKAKLLASSFLSRVLFNKKPIITEMVVDAFPNSAKGQVEKLSFIKELSKRGLRVHHKLMTFDQIWQGQNKLPGSLFARLKLKADICIRGDMLCGARVKPEEVRTGLQNGGFFLYEAVFCSQLVLKSIPCGGTCLTDDQVLAVFDKVVDKDTTVERIDFLLQRLKIELNLSYDPEQVLILWNEAWHTLDKVRVKDNVYYQLKSLLMLTALECGLQVKNQKVTVEQVDKELQPIRRLRTGAYLYFYLLVFCNRYSCELNGKSIGEPELMEAFRSFPEQSEFRKILDSWHNKISLDQNSKRMPLNIRESPTHLQTTEGEPFLSHSTEYPERNNIIDQGIASVVDLPASNNFQVSEEIIESQPEPLNDMTKKTLEIIQRVNSGYKKPIIFITGSLSRHLQGHCSQFKDIDIICMTWDAAKQLTNQFQIEMEWSSSLFPKEITVRDRPGCESLKLPPMRSVNWTYGMLYESIQRCQISIVGSLQTERAVSVTFDDDNRSVYCLPLEEETQLLIDRLLHLNHNFLYLMDQLARGTISEIPRTLLFFPPENKNQRTYGLFMHYLLTISVGKKFQNLQIQEQQNKDIDMLITNVLNMIKASDCFDEFMKYIEEWAKNVPEKESYSFHKLPKVEELMGLFKDVDTMNMVPA